LRHFIADDLDDVGLAAVGMSNRQLYMRAERPRILSRTSLTAWRASRRRQPRRCDRQSANLFALPENSQMWLRYKYQANRRSNNSRSRRRCQSIRRADPSSCLRTLPCRNSSNADRANAACRRLTTCNVVEFELIAIDIILLNDAQCFAEILEDRFRGLFGFRTRGRRIGGAVGGGVLPLELVPAAVFD